MSRAAAYLTIPPDYFTELGGWHWSFNCDAIEDGAGRTVILVDQLLLVLDGVFSAPGPPPPLACVLHLFGMATIEEWTGPPEPGLVRSLRNACRKTKSSPRNLGSLFAELCRGLPTFVDPPRWGDLAALLMERQLTGERNRPELLQVTSLGPTAFGLVVAHQLTNYDEPTLIHWLKFGARPAVDDKLLADVVKQVTPRAGSGLLEVLRQRDRLVGASTLVPSLDAALTIPPRQPRPDRMPQGGYADVTTRGAPDRLLPSQFALDPDEFVRRFSDNELLYFRREEPHHPTTPQRLLVLDQGVRTWGAVRHALTAGVIALLGKDPRKHGLPKLCLTSQPELLDPAELSAEALADCLEASDLSASPGDALTLALADPSGPDDPPRDVLLFTHPRNLTEGDVRAGARLRGPGDRLFTLTVDEDGRAELGEWSAGGHVPLRSFRADLATAEAARVARPAKASTPSGPTGGWTGDVEPVPFPFRAGLVADVERLGFDAAGEWVVVVGKDGAVQAQRVYGGEAVEVLPRAFYGGAVLKAVEEVIGVAGGVVLCGRRADDLLLGHYDFASRSVRVHRLGPVGDRRTLMAFPELHCVGVRTVRGAASEETTTAAVDLANSAHGDRCAMACARARTELPSPLLLPVANVTVPRSEPYLDVSGDALQLRRWPRAWSSVRPVSNGTPLVRDRVPLRAWLAGDVLGVVLKANGGHAKLYLIRGPDGTVLGEHRVTSHAHAFALSRDGSRLARQTGGRSAEVRDTVPGGAVTSVLDSGRYHTRLNVRLYPDRLHIRIGTLKHTLLLLPAFQHACVPNEPTAPVAEHQPAVAGESAVSYDPERFLDPVAAGPWVAAFDRWGQVVLLNRGGRVVLTVLVRREQVAVWLPDGTRWGAGPLLGGAGHPLAVERITAALRSATERPA